jgi:chromosome segregation ATPase
LHQAREHLETLRGERAEAGSQIAELRARLEAAEQARDAERGYRAEQREAYEASLADLRAQLTSPSGRSSTTSGQRSTRRSRTDAEPEPAAVEDAPEQHPRAQGSRKKQEGGNQ